MQFKTMCVAVVMGLGVAALPMQAAQAADPLETCNKATGKLVSSLLKELGKVVNQACSGKPLAEVAGKAATKLNKVIAKANAVDAKVDCATNGDPDLTLFPTMTTFDAAAVQAAVTTFVIQCNGIDD